MSFFYIIIILIINISGKQNYETPKLLQPYFTMINILSNFIKVQQFIFFIILIFVNGKKKYYYWENNINILS